MNYDENVQNIPTATHASMKCENKNIEANLPNL